MSTDQEIDVAVVGAGVVGLAIAAELAEAGQSVLVLERQAGPGRETSSRNSEVIHAGLYYNTGSLKARLCVEGRRLLYQFCQRHSVAHRRLGKLVVACSDDELPDLERLYALATANGVEGLALIERSELARLEPAVRGVAALHSTVTGIVDSHGLIKALEAMVRAGDGIILYQCELIGAEPKGGGEGGFQLRLKNPSGEETLHCRTLVNAAGLEADTVAAAAGRPGYRLHWCKGDYFSASGEISRAVSRLIYPLPSRNHLGIHVTLDLAGRMRFGPDATYVDRSIGQQPHLLVDETKAERFAGAVQRYLPRLRTDDLLADSAGIRPKLQGPADGFTDFIICSEADIGLPRLVSLLGIESPGLTASLAIGKMAYQIISKFN